MRLGLYWIYFFQSFMPQHCKQYVLRK